MTTLRYVTLYFDMQEETGNVNVQYRDGERTTSSTFPMDDVTAKKFIRELNDGILQSQERDKNNDAER